MADIQRVKVVWSGWTGSPGLTILYGADGAALSAGFRTFINGIKADLPDNVIITFPTSGDIVNDLTGDLNGAWTGGAVSNVTGTDPGNFFTAAGVGIRWNTTAIVFGRRLRGRTFLVPTTAAMWDTNGNLVPASVVGLQASVDAFVTANSPNFKVWSRPQTDRGGTSATVTNGAVIPKGVVLRSRRD